MEELTNLFRLKSKECVAFRAQSPIWMQESVIQLFRLVTLSIWTTKISILACYCHFLNYMIDDPRSQQTLFGVFKTRQHLGKVLAIV